jgi:PAS domain-containing protein
VPRANRTTAPAAAARDAMGDHFRDGAAMIRQPFCVYGADERLAAYNQAFADLHLRPDGACLLYPGIPFQEVMEWRRESGFFAGASHEDNLSTSHEYKLRLGDVIYQLADGRWMFVDNTPLPDGRLACIWSDITAVKEAERQLWELTRSLHRSHDHLYAAQRVAHVGSIERDLRTGAVVWTPEMYQIFDRDPAQPPPTRDEAPKLFHPEDRARYRAVMAAADEGTPAPPAEFRVVRPDGRIRGCITNPTWCATMTESLGCGSAPFATSPRFTNTKSGRRHCRRSCWRASVFRRWGRLPPRWRVICAIR